MVSGFGFESIRDEGVAQCGRAREFPSAFLSVIVSDGQVSVWGDDPDPHGTGFRHCACHLCIWLFDEMRVERSCPPRSVHASGTRSAPTDPARLEAQCGQQTFPNARRIEKITPDLEEVSAGVGKSWRRCDGRHGSKVRQMLDLVSTNLNSLFKYYPEPNPVTSSGH
jgi:hypothetical protein